MIKQNIVRLLMTLPIAVLLLQCSSANIPIGSFDKGYQSYMKYIPGAGGGRGISFRVTIPGSSENLKVNKFVVNGINLPFTFQDSILTASIFYEDPMPTLEEPNPEPADAVLFNQSTFEAVIHYSIDGQMDTVVLNNFHEEEQPLYP